MTFRSLDMSHYMLVMPRENAYDVMNQIGHNSTLHIASNNITHNQYHLPLKRCEELLQYIEVMKSGLHQRNMEIQQYNQNQDGFVDKLSEIWKHEAEQLGISRNKLLDFYEKEIYEEYERYHQINSRIDKISLKKKDIAQKIACYETVQSFFGPNGLQQESQDYYLHNAVEDKTESVAGISYSVGVIESQSEERFNRMIYRVSRGYACTKSLDSFKFRGLEYFNERVIMVIFPSTDSLVLSNKIQRVMQTFCTNMIEIESGMSSEKILAELIESYEETENYFTLNQKQMDSFLIGVRDIAGIQKWRTYLWKEKYVYESLNKVETRGNFMLADVYLPTKQVHDFSVALSKMTPSPTLNQLTQGKPPTAFDTNAYTAIAQQITDTYGVPRYKQINPSIFTTITFPFFFGVMFGDIGHGLVLLGLGIYLLLNDSWIRKSSMKMFSDLRYMITLMGFFAFYCGWIYNDFIGFNLNVFSSCYDPISPAMPRGSAPGDLVPVYPKDGCIYPFGIDPIWGRAENELVYLNSLKMKLAVIIAILHMTAGIIVKAYNAKYFNKKLDFYFEFVPQVIFMVILFGYMDFLIIFKWLKVWNEVVDDIPPRQWAPSIISTMMNIGLSMGETGDKPDGNSNMWGQRGNSWQDDLQLVILIIAFLCVPIMLLPKPIIEISRLKKKEKTNPLLRNTEDYSIRDKDGISASLISSGQYMDANLLGDLQTADEDQDSAKQEDASEIFVHQLIETIEFVLGAVSNTASYLRLWALSLAHSQLAKVFFQKTLQSGFQAGDLYIAIPSMIVYFYLLCWITFAVLMCMDSMQCFLHSLRLHWVEFQNKFYKGDGYRYQPISFRTHILEKKNSSNK